MTQPRKNPFYTLVVLCGVAFAVTTLAYVVAWVRLDPPFESTSPAEPGALMHFFNSNGETLIIWESVALTLAAILALALDRWRSVAMTSGRDKHSNGKPAR